MEVLHVAALPRLRHRLQRADSEPVLLQLAAGRLRHLPRLRARDRHRLRPDHPGRGEDAARGRDQALADPELQRVPGRLEEVRAETRRADGRAVARPGRGAQALGAGGRRRLGELEKVLARQVVRRAPLLRVAGEQELQDAHPRAALQVPRLHAVHRLRRRAPEARRAALAPGHEGGRGPRAAGGAALPPARPGAVRRSVARVARIDGARSDAASDRPLHASSSRSCICRGRPRCRIG